MIPRYQSSSRGNWLYVGGSGPGNYTRIQDAINASSDGDTVFVLNRIYYEIYKSGQINYSLGENQTGYHYRRSRTKRSSYQHHRSRSNHQWVHHTKLRWRPRTQQKSTLILTITKSSVIPSCVRRYTARRVFGYGIFWDYHVRKYDHKPSVWYLA